MSSLVKKIGKAVKSVGKSVTSFVKKLGPKALLIAALVAAPMLAAPAAASTASLGMAATPGIADAAFGFAAGQSAVSTGIAGAGSAAFTTQLGQIAKAGAEIAVAGGKPSFMSKIFGANHDKMTNGKFFSNLWKGVEGIGGKLEQFAEDHPFITKAGGYAMKEWWDRKKELEDSQYDRKWFGTSYGVDYQGRTYDPQAGEMVAATSDNLIVPGVGSGGDIDFGDRAHEQLTQASAVPQSVNSQNLIARNTNQAMADSIINPTVTNDQFVPITPEVKTQYKVLGRV